VTSEERTPNKNDDHMPMNEPPHENFLRTPLPVCVSKPIVKS